MSSSRPTWCSTRPYNACTSTAHTPRTCLWQRAEPCLLDLTSDWFQLMYKAYGMYRLAVFYSLLIIGKTLSIQIKSAPYYLVYSNAGSRTQRSTFDPSAPAGPEGTGCILLVIRWACNAGGVGDQRHRTHTVAPAGYSAQRAQVLCVLSLFEQGPVKQGTPRRRSPRAFVPSINPSCNERSCCNRPCTTCGLPRREQVHQQPFPDSK